MKALMKGDPLGGVHAFYSGSFREWWNPLRPGTRVDPPQRAGRRARQGRRVRRPGGARVVRRGVRGGRRSGAVGPVPADDPGRAGEGDQARARTTDTEIRPYTDEEIEAITEAVAAERDRRRGAEPRWWEDVAEGDEVGPLVKGPMRVTDMVVWHTGMGMGLYGVKALRLGARPAPPHAPLLPARRRSTSPTCSSGCTGTPSGPARAGNPTSYDYGRMRETWLIHLCTDWMGDDAWLWKLDCQFRKFNYVGDTHWMRGRVTRKHLVDGDRPAVDLDVWGENQRGETTTPGHATILLPSPRARRRCACPSPPAARRTCQEALDALAARFAAEEAERRPGEAVPGDPRRASSSSTTDRSCGIRLDRPDRRNAITDPIVYALVDLVDAAVERRGRSGDPPVRQRRPLLLGVRPRRAHARARSAHGSARSTGACTPT